MTSRREAQLIERVRALVVEACTDVEVELLDVELRGQGQHRVVRVVADTVDTSPDAGLDVDDIATVSRRIGEVLDAQDVVPGSYTLEVTSPGADRPLRATRDFLRNAGRDVVVHLRAGDTDDVDPGDGDAQGRPDDDSGPQTTGTVVGADESELTLDVSGERVTIALADIDHARVVLPW
ncbi:MAG: ribosome maturation factor RimP [Nitriliruptoraceae bacterium]